MRIGETGGQLCHPFVGNVVVGRFMRDSAVLYSVHRRRLDTPRMVDGSILLLGLDLLSDSSSELLLNTLRVPQYREFAI